jgi:Ricin-type beta-trefoil lectin domain-like/TIR domain
MRAVFISYRRDDSEGQAGRLYDDLVRRFGPDSVFMDVAGIEPGLDFRKAIDQNVATCAVLLAVMGPGWIDAKDEMGHRRLEDPTDFVRLETASALKRDIAVIPVLVHGAKMPRPEQLPEDLQLLAYRNGVELTHARWDSDVQVLIKGLQRHMESMPLGVASVAAKVDQAQDHTLPLDNRKSWRTLVLAAVAVAAIAAGVGYASYEYRKSIGIVDTSKYYKILAKHSGKALEVAGGPSAVNDQATIEQGDYTGGSNQQWHFDRRPDGAYIIIARHSGKVLDIPSGNAQEGAIIQQFRNHNGRNQEWLVSPVGGGLVRIATNLTGHVLDVKGGAPATGNGVPVQLWHENGGANQEWKLVEVGSMSSDSGR